MKDNRLTTAPKLDGAVPVRVVETLYDTAEEKGTEDERDTRLGQLAHDLRMPLSAISMGIQLVQRDVPAKAEILSSMQDTVRRMNRLIDQLSRYARRGGGELVLELELVALADICEEVIDEASLAYPGHPIEFEHYDDAPGEWDRDRLIQVVRNLLSNALRHGSPADPIIVSVIDRGDQALLAIANRGRPIPAAVRERLREPTVRREGSNDHLGLGIVREIVSAHGGRIELSSGDDATVFYVWLPKWREGGVRRDDERHPPISRFRSAPRFELSQDEGL
jgi:signal transduction histidine kinase